MTARAFPAVLLGGDSTVAACPAHETPMSGWGAHLGAPLNMYLGAGLAEAGLPPRVVPVLNTAKGGATTASYRAEGLWDALLTASLPGDTVLLQFGHNDQKEPRTLASREGFSANLSRFIADARGHGLVPILLTSVERRRFDGDRPVPTHGDYPLATRDDFRSATPGVLHQMRYRLDTALVGQRSHLCFRAQAIADPPRRQPRRLWDSPRSSSAGRSPLRC